MERKIQGMEEGPIPSSVGFLLPVNTGIASGSSIYPAIQNLMLAARALGLGEVEVHRPKVRPKPAAQPGSQPTEDTSPDPQ